jgi:hypothetical protein
MVHVLLDRPRTHAKRFADLGIGTTLKYELQDLLISISNFEGNGFHGTNRRLTGD